MSNMVVRTNIFSLNAHRNMKNVGLEQRRSSNRLASGYRINTAADDAAGLAISETMRAQIRGIDQASRNTQDGISMIQTAEGGLAEVVNMIQRVRELAVQGANDTNVSVNRQQLSYEVFQLTTEILETENRVQFNTINVLRLIDDGNNEGLEGRHLQIGANSNQSMMIELNLGDLRSPYDLSQSTLLFAVSSMLNHVGLAMLGVAGNNHVLGSSFNYSGDLSNNTVTWPQPNDNGTGQLQFPVNYGWLNGSLVPGSQLDLTQTEWISHMIGNVDGALNMVTQVRSTLGAMQNRLEHTMQNLDISSENLSDAESRVRNADMAREMMTLTMQNVLQQASVSMLSQANQMPSRKHQIQHPCLR